MQPNRHCLAAALALSLLLAPTTLPAAGKPAAEASAPLAIPPLEYRERKLANGLQVVSVEDHSSPTVSVQLWYHVGSKDDPQMRSGFAHLFEHLMFKSTKYLQAEQLDRLTEDVGGNNNASTNADYTNYLDVVPSNYLETLLWAEAERMANLDVKEDNFKSERAVVEEEYRQRVLAQPYGRLFNAIPRRSYLAHPYKRPGIGSIEDLEASTLADVVAFHGTYYRPDFATLIVAGDFDPKQLDAWVDKYFGPVPKPDKPVPPFNASEPPWPEDRHYSETAPNVPLPAVAITWLAPPGRDPDRIPLQVAASLLGAGDSSRLYNSLVYRQQLATAVGFDVDLRVDAGLVTAYAIAASGKTPAMLSRALMSEVERLARTPPTAAELDKVKTQLLTSALIERERPSGKAAALGDAILIEGNAARANTDLTDLQKVTAADVQRVVKRYLTGAHHVTIDYEQAKGKP
jgi:zinc protease